jgi:hypothetical protein
MGMDTMIRGKDGDGGVKGRRAMWLAGLLVRAAAQRKRNEGNRRERERERERESVSFSRDECDVCC